MKGENSNSSDLTSHAIARSLRLCYVVKSATSDVCHPGINTHGHGQCGDMWGCSQFLGFVCRYGAEPEAQLNPKKKIFEKISPDLRTYADGVAQYKSAPFMTSKGPVVSKLTNAAIK